MRETETSCCSICLASIVDHAYLQCSHSFCYSCIKQWANLESAKQSKPSFVNCPLCKRESQLILYNFDGVHFDTHSIDPDKQGFVLNEEHRFRLSCYNNNTVYGNLDLNRFWKLKLFLEPNKYLQTWLNRELQALTRNQNPYVLVHHIIGTIEHFQRSYKLQKEASSEVTRKNFKRAIIEASKEFLESRVEKFVEEIEVFLASQLNLAAYDRVYKSEKDKDEDCKLYGWVSDKLSDFLLSTNKTCVIHCIKLARCSMSLEEYEFRLLEILRLPSTKRTSTFAKLVYDKVSSHKEKEFEGRPLSGNADPPPPNREESRSSRNSSKRSRHGSERSVYSSKRSGYGSERSGHSGYQSTRSGYGSGRSGYGSERSGHSGYQTRRSGCGSGRSGYGSERSEPRPQRRHL